MDSLLKIISELLHLPFQYPALFPVIVIIGTLAIEFRWVRHLLSNGGHAFRAFWLQAIAGLLGIFLVLSSGAWIIYRYWGVPTQFGLGQIGVVIAEIPGDNADRTQQRTYEHEIHEGFNDTDDLRGRATARLLMRPLPLEAESEMTEARKLGRWVNATFILRPQSVEGVQRVYLTVVNPSSLLKPELSLGKFQTAELANLEELQLPKISPS
jgi:hypothetical protein